MSGDKLIQALTKAQPGPRGRRGADMDIEAHQRDLFSRVGTKDICLLTRQLSTLLRAGMPLTEALTALTDQLHDAGPRAGKTSRKDRTLARITADLHERVNSGDAFSAGLARYPKLFPPLYVSMVETGQATGNLERTLMQLADMYEKRVQLTAQLRAALTYPLMMCAVAVSVVLFLLAYVVPSIAAMLTDLGKVLPWPTVTLISVSGFLKRYLFILLVGIGLAGVLLRKMIQTERGKEVSDRCKLQAPLVGRLFLKVDIARLSRTLGTLLSGGVPILNALQISKAVLQNQILRQALTHVEAAVRQGASLAQAIRDTGQFPPVIFHILSTGQASGNLEEGLLDIADMYDNDVQATSKTLSSLVEPTVLLLMGMVVGFIVLAILLPIFEINQTL